MNVLVVGGAGYIGGAVTDLLMRSKYNFRVYDALLYEECYRKPVDFIYGDIRDLERLKPHIEWADVILWLAALVGDNACALDPEITEAINRTPLKWVTDNFNKRIIFLSSCSVYGAQDEVLDENSPTNPLSVYAVTKLESEEDLRGKNAIIFRLGTMFGVSDQFSRIRFDLVVNTLTLRAYQRGKIAIFGGDQFRPLLHVQDTARAVVDNIETAHTGVYNLHRQNVRIIDLAYQVRNHFPDMEIELTPMKFQDSRNYRVSSKKAEEIWGFKAMCSIDQGIEEIKDLLESRRLKDLDNPRYTNHVFLSMFNTHTNIANRGEK